LAHAWYRQRNAIIGGEFLMQLDFAMDAIAEHPGRGVRVGRGCRRYLLRKFPFSVVYMEQFGAVEVIAIAHHRRRPGYWQARL
jgi:hypothetical protein